MLKSRFWGMGCLLATTAVAIGALAALGASQRQGIVQGQRGWQYATLSVATAGGLTAVWVEGTDRYPAGGSSAFSVLNKRLGGNASVRNVYELLEQIGANGWELVQVSSQDAPPLNPDTPFPAVWIFKRG